MGDGAFGRGRGLHSFAACLRHLVRLGGGGQSSYRIVHGRGLSDNRSETYLQCRDGTIRVFTAEANVACTNQARINVRCSASHRTNVSRCIPLRAQYSFVACLSRSAIDHASLSRRSTVCTSVPNRDTFNIWALVSFFSECSGRGVCMRLRLALGFTVS